MKLLPCCLPPCLIAVFASAALAQLSLPWDKPGAASAAGGEAAKPAQAAVLDLGSKWTVVEVGEGTTYTGTWLRRPGTQTFDASWQYPDGKVVLTRDRSGKTTKTHEITVDSINGNQIVLLRPEIRGRYLGTLAADGRHITGTRSWNAGTWSATIETQPAAAAPVAASATATDADADAPPAAINSPDGKSSVRLLQQPLPGNDGVVDFFTLEVLSGTKVVARVATEGYLISAHWSLDGRLLAVNNRRGNSGDYLWVFALPDGTCIKKAGDPVGDAWLAAAKLAIQQKVPTASEKSAYKNWLTAREWSSSGELQINQRIRYGATTGTCDFSAPAAFRDGKWSLLPGTVSVTPADP